MTDITTQHVVIDDQRIAYIEQGKGTPLILIHGIPTSKLLWRHVLPALAATRRVLAPDLLNYGESDKPLDANVSIEAQSRMIVKFMDALDIAVADMVAHDIGGGVAQLIAVNYPERVGKLVLIDSVCFDSWPIPEFLPLLQPGAEDGFTTGAFITMMREFMPQGVHDKAAMSDAVIDLYMAPWSTKQGMSALFRNFRRLNCEYTQAIAGDLKHLRQPTLIVWAENDAFQKPEYATLLHETIPGSQLVWIKQAGHWLMEERADEVSGHLIEFLGAS